MTFAAADASLSTTHPLTISTLREAMETNPRHQLVLRVVGRDDVHCLDITKAQARKLAKVEGEFELRVGFANIYIGRPY